MQVIRADAMGMCFGVRDALTMLEALPDPRNTTIHGELVHNEVVLDRLRNRGFVMEAEGDRRSTPATSTIVITAHGISDRERHRLEGSGKHLVDTTCPLVGRVHQAVRDLKSAGYFILVIGQPGHVEVEGLIGDLDEYEVIPAPDAVRPYGHSRLGIVCQTTASPRRVEAIRQAIHQANPDAEIRFVDTVCRPTRERQEALVRMLDRVEAVVVIGGRNSNNTRELLQQCRERGRPAWHVQCASDLNPDWFDGVEVVGLTAGTSTPDITIDEVERALIKISGRVGATSRAPVSSLRAGLMA